MGFVAIGREERGALSPIDWLCGAFGLEVVAACFSVMINPT
jgi:hypothetical protein